MTAEEAIKIIERKSSIPLENESFREIEEACDMAINALKKVQDYERQWADDSINPLEPLKLSCALNSELFKLKYRKENKPKEICSLDYTVIAALQDCLKRYAGQKGARKDEA